MKEILAVEMVGREEQRLDLSSALVLSADLEEAFSC